MLSSFSTLASFSSRRLVARQSFPTRLSPLLFARQRNFASEEVAASASASVKEETEKKPVLLPLEECLVISEKGPRFVVPPAHAEVLHGTVAYAPGGKQKFGFIQVASSVTEKEGKETSKQYYFHSSVQLNSCAKGDKVTFSLRPTYLHKKTGQFEAYHVAGGTGRKLEPFLSREVLKKKKAEASAAKAAELGQRRSRGPELSDDGPRYRIPPKDAKLYKGTVVYARQKFGFIRPEKEEGNTTDDDSKDRIYFHFSALVNRVMTGNKVTYALRPALYPHLGDMEAYYIEGGSKYKLPEYIPKDVRKARKKAEEAKKAKEAAEAEEQAAQAGEAPKKEKKAAAAAA